MMIVIVNFMEENIFIEENRQDYGSGKEDPSSYQNGPRPNPFAPIVINGKAIEVVSTVSLLGLNTSTDLRWNCHVAEISKKVASRLYFLKQLKRANIPTKDLLIFYLTCIRPVTEYACPVFHNALPAYLSTELEQLQKRAMRIIFPFVPRRVCKGNDPLFPSSRASPLCVVWTSLVCRFLGGEQDMRHQTGPWNNT